MQVLYYELSDKGAKAEFGRYCVSKRLFKHDIVERENLIKRSQLSRMETILECYKEYKKDKK